MLTTAEIFQLTETGAAIHSKTETDNEVKKVNEKNEKLKIKYLSSLLVLELRTFRNHHAVLNSQLTILILQYNGHGRTDLSMWIADNQLQNQAGEIVRIVNRVSL
jgi:hypothetical protein